MSETLNFKQELTACFGQPVSENPTQAMIEPAYRHHGLDWRYLTIEVAPEGLADAVRGARAMGFRGFNCTIPHKVAVIEHLDGLGESASLMGAVNCVVNRHGKLIGENTDGKGFVSSLRALTAPTGKRVVMFGAGGAAGRGTAGEGVGGGGVDGGFAFGLSPIHLFVPLVLWGSYGLVSAARAGDMETHKRKILRLYLGALTIPGIVAFVWEGRMMNVWLLG